MNIKNQNSREYRNKLKRIFSKTSAGKKIWNIEKDNSKEISYFLMLCTSKLTINEMDEIALDDMKKAVEDISSGKVDKKILEKMTADEFFDFVIRQGRLFE